jgi:hypothetical protein
MPGLASVPDRVEFQEVVRGAHERPLSLHLRKTSVQELAESPRLFDLAEDRFNDLTRGR